MATGIGDASAPEESENHSSTPMDTSEPPTTTNDSSKNADVTPPETKSDEKQVAKPEHTWHDVAVVKSTSFTVNYYLEKQDPFAKDENKEGLIEMPDQVRFLIHRFIALMFKCFCCYRREG